MFSVAVLQLRNTNSDIEVTELEFIDEDELLGTILDMGEVNDKSAEY